MRNPRPTPGDGTYLFCGPKNLRFIPGVIIGDSRDGSLLHISIKDVGDFEFPEGYFKRIPDAYGNGAAK